MTLEIFVHRAMLNAKENSLEGILNCVKNDFSLELDLRYNGHVYLTHGKNSSNTLFEDACKILQNSKSLISLHIKEFFAIQNTIEIINKFSLQNNSFLFMTDFDYNDVKNIVTNNVEIAYYASNLPSITNSKFYWCDETQSKWYDKKNLEDLHAHNIFCIAMSPELTKKANKDEIQSEWERFINLDFDGICTNFPLELKDFVENSSI